MLECHERIRLFTKTSIRIGTERDALDADIVRASEDCERYFTTSLRLHIEDEERSIEPRLRLADPACSSSLDAMTTQHKEHAPLLDSLCESLRRLRESPANASLREAAGATAIKLSALFEEHLTLEETIIFPAVQRALSPEVQRTIVNEVRARRRI